MEPVKPVKPTLYTLVLDMDETLVHFDPRRRMFRTRPHVQNFLREMSQHWEIVVFTAGLKDYADWILNDLDPNRYISRRLYRDSCTFRRGSYLKDLKKLHRDLSKCVIVDNLPENFALQKDNGIGIKSWFNDNGQDCEILKLQQVLFNLMTLDDVREGIRKIRGMLTQ